MRMRTAAEVKAGLSSGSVQENIRALLEIRYRHLLNALVAQGWPVLHLMGK
jgi:hypothetical protein